MTYTIFANRLNDLEKAYRRYAKKANAIGLETSMEVIKRYPKKIAVYENDHINKVTVRTGWTVVEVVDVEINFPEYKLGNYTVVAVLEHTDNGNTVYNCTEEEVPTRYFTAKGICEHCGTNHKRVKTIVLKDVEGTYKQVGRACLKEYTGVDDVDLVGAYEALNNITLDADANNGWFGTAPKNDYTETNIYLAKCINYIKNNGYVKDVTKYDACKIKSNELTDEDYKDAETVIDYFKNIETTDTFINNIKVAVNNEYIDRVNGFVAYAYVAYTKAIEKNKNNEIIEFYGNVNDKFKDIEVIGRVLTGYATYYGWTNIIEFKDNNNHVFIWKTDKNIDVNNDGTWTGTISGTIKAHNDYKGTKQTVVTRVKANKKIEEPTITVTFDEEALRKALEKIN